MNRDGGRAVTEDDHRASGTDMYQEIGDREWIPKA